MFTRVKTILTVCLLFAAAPLFAGNGAIAENINPFFKSAVSGTRTMSFTKDGHPLGYIPPPLDYSYLKGRGSESHLSKARNGLPTYYDLRAYDKVTEVKDQGSCGSCWAFANMGALESFLKPSEIWNFSENNLKNTHGFDWTHCYGGNEDMAIAYLARRGGPVTEAQDPYSETSNVSPSGLTPSKYLQEALRIPARGSYTDNDAIKSALMTYGAVASDIYWKDSAYSSANDSYYCGNCAGSNHEVAIVGWNDNYPAGNFVSTAPANGAFIVKNSWGTSWGDEGYFYVSYYDNTFGQHNVVYASATATTIYDNIYQYDPFGKVADCGFFKTTAWGANIFTTYWDEALKAVSFYTNDVNTAYSGTVYIAPTTSPTTGTSSTTFSGTFALPGYHTVKISPPVRINREQKFSVVVEFSNSSYIYPVPIQERQNGYTSNATTVRGRSYFSEDGSTWLDMLDASFGAKLPVVNIKAFTDNLSTPAPKPQPGVDPLKEVYAYPNPWRADRSNHITIARLPYYNDDTQVLFYDMHGKLLRTLDTTNNIVISGAYRVATWDGKNEDGEKVASGVYIYMARSQGYTKTGKLGVLW